MNISDIKTIPSCGYSSEEAKQVAQIILEQIGGNSLRIMTGANGFLSDNSEGRGALSFRFKGSPKTNHLKIILTVMDTYTLRFGRVTKRGYKVVETVEDIYNDSLTDVFRRVTGLETRVPRIRGIPA